MMDIALVVLSLCALIAAAICDVRKNEVPDWISYGFLFSASAILLLNSIFTNNYAPLLSGFLGFVVFSLVSYAMYHYAQWGGADAKLAMGFGVVIGLSSDALLFLFLILFIGAIYGVIWAVVLAFRNKKKFAKAFVVLFSEWRIPFIWAIALLVASLLAFILGIYSVISFLFLGLSVIFAAGLIMFMFVRAVELVCFVKKVRASQLTEGDWVTETIRINGRVVISEKNQGITKGQIRKLENYKKLITIKSGIPFVPVFLLSFIALLVVQHLHFVLK